MKYKACIVETRLITNIVEIIKSHLVFLPTKYTLHIFVSDKNKSQFINCDFGRKTEITILKNDINNLADYNRLMTSLNFWQNLNCNKALIFQSDSGILRSGIEEFEEYDWVGAPWKTVDPRWVHGSNGGLSLRSVDAMIHCIDSYEYNGQNEDGYFSLLIKNIGGKTSRDINYRFSVETEYKLGTFGYHAINKHLTTEQIYNIKNQYN